MNFWKDISNAKLACIGAILCVGFVALLNESRLSIETLPVIFLSGAISAVALFGK